MKLAFATSKISLAALAPYCIESLKASCSAFVGDAGCTFVGGRSTSVLTVEKSSGKVAC